MSIRHPYLTNFLSIIMRPFITITSFSLILIEHGDPFSLILILPVLLAYVKVRVPAFVSSSVLLLSLLYHENCITLLGLELSLLSRGV